MSASQTPKASASTSTAAKAFGEVGNFERFDVATSDWRPSGRPAFPDDEAEREKLSARFDKLSKTFNVKVPDEPLELAKDARPGSPRLDPKHLPGKPTGYERGLQRAWKGQKRTRCSEPGCYYPVHPKKLPEFNHEPLSFAGEDGSEVIAGECSWEPRHAGGLQFIPVPRNVEE